MTTMRGEGADYGCVQGMAGKLSDIRKANGGHMFAGARAGS